MTDADWLELLGDEAFAEMQRLNREDPERKGFKPVLTHNDVSEVLREELAKTEEEVVAHIDQCFGKHDGFVAEAGPAARVDFNTLCKRLQTSSRTMRRYIAAEVIPVDQVFEGGKLMFDLVAVERALKRYRRRGLGDDD